MPVNKGGEVSVPLVDVNASNKETDQILVYHKKKELNRQNGSAKSNIERAQKPNASKLT